MGDFPQLTKHFFGIVTYIVFFHMRNVYYYAEIARWVGVFKP